MYNYAGRPLAKAPGTSPDSTLDENHQRISLVIETELHGVAKEGYLTQLQAIREAEKWAARRFLLGKAASAG